MKNTTQLRYEYQLPYSSSGKEYRQNLGVSLGHICKTKNMSIRDIAERVEDYPQNVHNVFKGRRAPSFDKLIDMYGKLGLKITMLVEEKDK